jgi:nucleoside-diphosphate-sugar epimerase
MRVLVTGHNGYIGTVMVPILLANGHNVNGLDTNYFNECIFTNKKRSVPEKSVDIRDVTLGDVEGFDAIIHLAALSNDPLGDLNPKLTYEINFESSVKLAELAKKAGVKKFIFSSTCSVYGTSEGRIVNETTDPIPLTAYADSKVMAEKDISKMASSSFSPTFLRSATAYGVSPRLRSDLVVNNLVGWAYLTGKIYLKSDGQAWRPLVHIEDISRAFLSVLNAESKIVKNQIFNVGKTEENYKIIDVAKLVNQVVPNSIVEFAEGAEPDKRTYRVDFSKIKTYLPSFQPKWTVKKGSEELFQAYEKYNMIMDSLEGARFKRLKHLQKLIDQGRIGADLKWSNGD